MEIDMEIDRSTDLDTIIQWTVALSKIEQKQVCQSIEPTFLPTSHKHQRPKGVIESRSSHIFSFLHS